MSPLTRPPLTRLKRSLQGCGLGGEFFPVPGLGYANVITPTALVLCPAAWLESPFRHLFDGAHLSLRPSDDRFSKLESQLDFLKEEAERLRAQIQELQASLIDRESLLALADDAFVMRLHQSDHLQKEVSRRQKVIDTVLESRVWRTAQSINPNGEVFRRVADLMKGSPASLSEHYGLRYVPRVTDRVDANKLEVKAIAFYRPAFRSLSEAQAVRPDHATGWPRVEKALPRYFGQLQPRLPGELGFYDNAQPETLRNQVELAQQYGIHGFCFYHYWTDETHDLQPPLRQFIAEDLNFKFCLCLMSEMSRPGEEFLKTLLPALSDPRYIRIAGK